MTKDTCSSLYLLCLLLLLFCLNMETEKRERAKQKRGITIKQIRMIDTLPQLHQDVHKSCFARPFSYKGI